MGLLQAGIGAVGGVLGDQWKEYIYCDSLPPDVLMAKGHRKTGNGSSNKGDDNIISQGSRVAVNNGQCLIIVENGEVVDICAEPGEYTYDRETEPSLFTGDLSDTIPKVFAEIGRRFSFGGDTGRDQRVYYINTKEIYGNKFGTPSPIAFKVRDDTLNYEQTIQIRCFGEYSYRITNPVLFYTNIASNVSDTFNREEIDSQLKSELMMALKPAMAKVSAMRVGYDELEAHSQDIADALNDSLSQKWGNLRGIEVVSVAVASVSLTDESQAVLEKLQKMQEAAVLGRDPSLMAGFYGAAQADALRDAANNEGGAAIGFMGMNMAGNANGINVGDMMAQGQAQRAAQAQQAAARQAAPAGGWTCACGHSGNTGKFCSECGAAKPDDGWTCACGAKNTGKFCSECGKPRPAGDWVCACGAKNSGKFCAECGSPRP